MERLTPREIVEELDKYIVGQRDAKRAAAIALRNRWRRQQLPQELRDEVAPKNIIMIGPTGVGKTEIARRLAKLTSSPFLKIEASKFTEVGYVGRDVESIVRDLTELSINMVKAEKTQEVKEKAAEVAEEKMLDLLLPSPRVPYGDTSGGQELDDLGKEHYQKTREKFRQYLREGKFDDRFVEIDVQERAVPMIEIMPGSGLENMDISFQDMLGNIFPKKKKKRKEKVPEALRLMTQEEAQKLVDMDAVTKEAISRVEQSGIVFLDEIDKITGGRDGAHGPDVSREGVQRDLLPIIEGCTVNTKYGMVKTDHVFFIAAGAFHVAKPSDLIPEMQGRFPIRVELDSLGKEEFIRILTEPQNALIKQYVALLGTENVTIKFTDDAVAEIAGLAELVNERTENIGARRLHTIMEKLLDEISFDAPDRGGEEIEIDARYVREKLEEIIKDEDLSRYIL